MSFRLYSGIELPTWKECDEIPRLERNALQAFIWEHEPSEADGISAAVFRAMLRAVVAEAKA